jgi:predicted RNA-binding Zn-ribbon protein involved in translation (DUF1610 family)
VAYGVGVPSLSLLIIARMPFGPPPTDQYVTFGYYTIAVAGLALLLLFHRRRITVSIRQQLNANNIPVCMKCGYDLRGRLSHACPECGTPVMVMRDTGSE